ncbi:MAG TPA: DUF1592 domain-containing protein [Polyangiaceae bacterium]|nr:DUF1592 domain-containing protein [Polyangiaceae bacterium]
MGEARLLKKLVPMLSLLALGGACGRTAEQCEACGAAGAGSAGAGALAGAGGALAGAGGATNTAGQLNTGGLALMDCDLGGLEAPLIRYSTVDLERSLDMILGPGPGLDQGFVERANTYARAPTINFVSALQAAALARIEAYTFDEAALSICEVDVQDRTNCVDTWVAERGLELYRRPLSADQVAGYVAQFREQSSATTPAAAARSVLLSMVLSPYFIFRIELGAKLTSALAQPPPGTPYPTLPPGSPLSEYEIAARLSHFLARRAPDATLLAAVAQGAFRNRSGHLAEAERLLQSPVTLQARTRLHLEWLRLDETSSPSDDLDPNLHRLMLEQSLIFMDGVLSHNGSFTDLLTSSRQPLNRPLAEHYGVSSPTGDAFELVELEPALYAGVLGQGAWLSRHPTPSFRGVGVLDELLCSPPPLPPPSVDPSGYVGNTPRERISNATASPPCSACHQLFDPMGFALEAFDDQGRLTGYDTTGTFTEDSETLELAGPLALGQALALSGGARACIARRYLEYAIQNQLAIGNEQWLECLTTAFGGSDLDLNHLAKTVAVSDAIKRKLSEPIEAVGASSAGDPIQHAIEETQGLMEGFQTPGDRSLLTLYVDALTYLSQVP